jgi:hypothetical protein
MGFTRRFFASAVLQDGRVLVAGGEYGTGWGTAEVYNPLSDQWTQAPVPAGLLNLTNNPGQNGQNSAGFTDSICKILSDGTVLVAPNFPSPGTGFGTLIYNPAANAWAPGPPSRASQNEASWVKLPDDSILTVDKSSTTSERYLPPPLGRWTNDAPVQDSAGNPISLYDPNG